MRTNSSDLLLTAIAPIIWGSTYIVTTQFLPAFSPMTVSILRALPAGLLLLVPVALIFEPTMPVPTTSNLLGLAWLGLIGAALTYALWFRGIGRLESAVASSLLFLSPLTAVLLGWCFLDQALSLPSVSC